MTRRAKTMLDPGLVRQAAWDAALKLDPRRMARNPVMFVVETTSVLVAVLAIMQPTVFAWSIAVWLWFTVFFANFAEAMAEGRGKAQAETLRRTRSETIAHRRTDDGTIEDAPSSRLALGDVVVVSAGELIPADGEVIEGIASVDESAITGESAPVIRESGGDRSAVTGGTRVLSDQIVVRVTQQPGRELPRPDDRPRGGVVAAEDAQRDRARHPARGAHDHLSDRSGDAAGRSRCTRAPVRT